MKFISRNGYIEVSIHGCNFCVGCFKAFKLLANNILRVAAINTVGDFVLFLGKLVVVVSTVFIGIEIVDLRSQEDGKVNHVWAPITLAAIFAYLTASCFIGVYEVSWYLVNDSFSYEICVTHWAILREMYLKAVNNCRKKVNFMLLTLC